MTPSLGLDRIFVLRAPERSRERTPPRALGVSVLALVAAVVAAVTRPEEAEGMGGVVWILALVPCFLLSYYRGWKGAALAMVLGMLAITLAELAGATLLDERVDWWVYGLASVSLLVTALGTGVTTELLQRAGGDPHVADRRWRTGRELEAALVGDQFRLHYQPIVDLEERRVCGAEALLRWEHPRSGVLPPDFFLPTAEATELIGPLGEWTLERACRDLPSWRDGFDLRGDFRLDLRLPAALASRPERVLDILERHRVPAGRIRLSVAHRAMMVAGEGLAILRERGARILLDEFGSGALSDLTWFELDGLKLEPTLTAELPSNARCMAILRAVLSLGRELGLEVVAGGVESPAQLRALRSLGFRRAQGFIFGQELPLREALLQAEACGRRLESVSTATPGVPGSPAPDASGASPE